MWSGRDLNGDLTILFTHLLSLNDPWTKADITVHSIVSSEKAKKRLEKHLRERLSKIQINAEVKIHIESEEESNANIIHRYSSEATATFMGMSPEGYDEKVYLEQMKDMSDGLSTKIFMHNAEAGVPVLLGLETPI